MRKTVTFVALILEENLLSSLLSHERAIVKEAEIYLLDHKLKNACICMILQRASVFCSYISFRTFR